MDNVASFSPEQEETWNFQADCNEPIEKVHVIEVLGPSINIPP